jgi:hypothetical protein
VNHYARTSPGVSLEIIPIERPHSLFKLMEERFRGCDPLCRIFSQVRVHDGQTMVVEVLGCPDDLREENEDLRKHSPDFAGSVAHRLSFFKKKFSTRRGLASAKDQDFIGYAVLKADRAPSFGRSGVIRRVYESVITPSRHDNNFIRGSQVWPCRVDGRPFKVCGYLYAQQNGLTNICAHVALRTAAARFHPAGDMSYREMNDLLGFDQVNKKTEGLNLQQMVRVLEAAGAACFQADYSQPNVKAPPFQKYLYGSIESGFPAIIIFGTTAADGSLHAIPIFGHTFNQDTWVPNAEDSYFKVGEGTKYFPSESWLSMFVAHDDNWGSNYCIPRHYLQPWQNEEPTPEPAPQPNSVKPNRDEDALEVFVPSVAHIISTMPKEVKLNPLRAEVIGADFLFSILPQLPPGDNPWAQRLLRYANKSQLVLRPYLLDPTEYTTHLAKIKDWHYKSIRSDLVGALKTNLTKERLWMIELSVPELFSANLRKLGEVLLRAEVLPTENRDFGSFVLARLPGYFALFDGGTPNSPSFQFIPSGADGHVELIGCEDKGHV